MTDIWKALPDKNGNLVLVNVAGLFIPTNKGTIELSPTPFDQMLGMGCDIDKGYRTMKEEDEPEIILNEKGEPI